MRKSVLCCILSLSCLAATAASVRLVWNANPPSEQVRGYWVYVAAGTNEITDVIKTNPSPAAYRFNVAPDAYLLVTNGASVQTNIAATVTNLTPGVYKFRVTSTNVWDESQFSAQVALPPGSPSAPAIGDITVVIP